MTKISLFKFTTAVVYLIFTPVLAGAQGATSSSCAALQRQIYEGVDAFRDTCQNRETCVQRALKCNSVESLVATRFSTNLSPEDDCNDKINLACPELNLQSIPGYQQNLADANRRRWEATEDREEAAASMPEILKQNRERQTELDKQAMEVDQKYLEERQTMAEELQTAMEGIDEQKAQALIEAQNKYMEMDQAYIEMRRDLRQMESEVSLLKGRWESDCAAKADAAAKEMEKALNAYLAESSQKAGRTNVSMRMMSGSKKRRQKWARDKIKFEYAEFHKKCRLGLVDPGLSISNALKESQHKLFNGQAEATDKAAALEKQRLQINENLKGLDASSQKKIQALMQKQQQRAALLDRARMSNHMIIQKAKMDAQTDLSTVMAFKGGQVQSASLDGVDASQDALMAGTRLRCEHADSESQAAVDNFDKVYGAIRKVDNLCNDIAGACSGLGDSSTREALTKLCSRYQEVSATTPAPPTPAGNHRPTDQ